MKPILKSQLRFIGLSALTALLPLLAMIGVFYVSDPFNLFKAMDKPASFPIIGNKGFLTVNNFEHHLPLNHYNSFIFGSSLNISTPVEEWVKYLPEGAVPFHFDSSAMSVKQMREYLEYLASKTEIRNMYIILCRDQLDCEFDSMDPTDAAFLTSPKLYHDPLYAFRVYKLFWQFWLSNENIERLARVQLLRRGKLTFEKDSLSTNVDLYDPVTNTEYITYQRFDRIVRDADRPYPLADSLQVHPPVYAQPFIDCERYDDLSRFAAILDSLGTDYRIVMTSAATHSGQNIELTNPADSIKLRNIFGDRFISAQWPTMIWTYNPKTRYDKYHFSTPQARKLMEFVYNDSLRAAHPGHL